MPIFGPWRCLGAKVKQETCRQPTEVILSRHLLLKSSCLEGFPRKKMKPDGFTSAAVAADREIKVDVCPPKQGCRANFSQRWLDYHLTPRKMRNKILVR